MTKSSNINLSELNTNGSQLFADSENFLTEMSEQELADVMGGQQVAAISSPFTPIVSSAISVSISANMFGESQNSDNQLDLPPGSDVDLSFTDADLNIPSFNGIDPGVFTNGF